MADDPGIKEFTDFWSYLKEFKSLSGIITAVLAILPMGGATWTEPLPPYMDWLPFLASLFTGLTVLSLFLAYRESTPDKIEACGRKFGVAIPVLVVLYLVAFFAFIGKDQEQRFLRGIGLTADAQKLSDTSDVNVLRQIGRTDTEQDGIWKFRGVVKSGLATLTIAVFCSLGGCFSLFVLKNMAIRRGRKP